MRKWSMVIDPRSSVDYVRFKCDYALQLSMGTSLCCDVQLPHESGLSLSARSAVAVQEAGEYLLVLRQSAASRSMPLFRK